MACVKFVVLFGLIVSSHAGSVDKQDIPPEIFPTDKSNYKIIPKNESLLHGAMQSTAPLLFPEKGSNYTIINNPSLLGILKSHAEHGTDKFSEVNDLLKEDWEPVAGNRTHEESETAAKETAAPKADVGPVQDASRTEDARGGSSRGSHAGHFRHDHVARGGVPPLQGRTAAVLVCAFVVTAIFGYAALLLWRRYLENRYGTREMLINEDDFSSYTNDMKNFEL